MSQSDTFATEKIELCIDHTIAENCESKTRGSLSHLPDGFNDQEILEV